MNILLINPGDATLYAKPPLGLLSVATVCRQAGHRVDILDMHIAADCSFDGYDLIGLTAMTPTVRQAMELAVRIGRKPPVVIGGVHATLFPEELYLTGLFDAVVMGEGEGVVLELLADQEAGRLKPIYKAPQLGEVPVPDYSLISINAYRPRYPHAKREPWTSVQTSRGCPYSCRFCSNIFGHKYRAMLPGQVYGLLDTLCTQYGVRDLTFYDDEFTLDRRRVVEMCNLLVQRPLDLEWTCEARVDLVDMELLTVMRKAGCRLIYYGIESGDQHILDRLNKTITLARVDSAVRFTREAGIKAAAYFMLGCPGETRETMKRTVDYARELRLDHAQFSVCSPLPGSALYEQYGRGKDWGRFQYLGGGEKACCSTEVGLDEVEAAVESANAEYSRCVA